jgi:hypothetical protein
VTHPFFVPVRTSKAGTLALRTGRLESGERIGLAFTSDAALLLTMGPAQQWIQLDGQALTDMLAPLGVEHVRVDPRPVKPVKPASPVSPVMPASPVSEAVPRTRPSGRRSRTAYLDRSSGHREGLPRRGGAEIPGAAGVGGGQAVRTRAKLPRGQRAMSRAGLQNDHADGAGASLRKVPARRGTAVPRPDSDRQSRGLLVAAGNTRGRQG